MKTRYLQAGLSLIELMISMTLGLIILSGVLVVFVNTSTARTEVERTSRQIENGRYASEILSEDIRLAGFYGELNVGQVGTPAGLPGNPCSILPADWRSWIPVHLQGYDDTGFVSADCALTNLKSNTDVLVIRRARACLVGDATCEATATTNKPYLQVALCADQAASITTAYKLGLQGAETFDRQKKGTPCPALPGGAADKRQYFVHIYFIATDNGQGQNIPTLKRLELTGDTTGVKWDLVPLVEGIEEFQLHYGLDTSPAGGDGVPDVYVANPNNYPVGACTGTCPLSNWMKVVTVQFHILARNLETSPNYTDAKTYNFGNDVNGNPITRTPGGAYRRHIYSGLVRVANPAGRKDTP